MLLKLEDSRLEVIQPLEGTPQSFVGCCLSCLNTQLDAHKLEDTIFVRDNQSSDGSL